MIKKILIFSLISFFFIFQSCYTIGYPTPCPGLVDSPDISSNEICVSLND